MSMRILNPFDYGGPVSGNEFAGREHEVQAVLSRLQDHIGIVVTAPRRYGKSSLIKQASEKLAKLAPAPAIVHVNLLQAGSMSTASGLLLRSLYRAPGGSWHRLKNVVPSFLRRLRVQPSTTFDASGNPTFSFSPSLAAEDLSRVVDDVYEILDEIGAKRPAVLFLDEFQASTDLDEHLPRRLKALADQHRNVSLVLAGSKQHVMESLVLAQSAPLYNMLERIALGPIPEEEWVPFLLERARIARKPFATESSARGLYAVAGPVPFDVQQLAYEAFNQAAKKIDGDSVATALTELVRHHASDYATSFESLSAGRRRVLKALAIGTEVTTGSSQFATQVGLSDATSVRKALNQLREAELIVQREGQYAVDDPFFAAWLRS
jgi:AAA+ ATPase superfamily predicted ATPase